MAPVTRGGGARAGRKEQERNGDLASAIAASTTPTSSGDDKDDGKTIGRGENRNMTTRCNNGESCQDASTTQAGKTRSGAGKRGHGKRGGGRKDGSRTGNAMSIDENSGEGNGRKIDVYVDGGRDSGGNESGGGKLVDYSGGAKTEITEVHRELSHVGNETLAELIIRRDVALRTGGCHARDNGCTTCSCGPMLKRRLGTFKPCASMCGTDCQGIVFVGLTPQELGESHQAAAQDVYAADVAENIGAVYGCYHCGGKSRGDASTRSGAFASRHELKLHMQTKICGHQEVPKPTACMTLNDAGCLEDTPNNVRRVRVRKIAKPRDGVNYTTHSVRGQARYTNDYPIVALQTPSLSLIDEIQAPGHKNETEAQMFRLLCHRCGRLAAAWKQRYRHVVTCARNNRRAVSAGLKRESLRAIEMLEKLDPSFEVILTTES